MRPRIVLALALVLIGGTALRAQTLAFTPNGTGLRQDYRFSLGLFFDLSDSLTIASVGYWDDNLDGLSLVPAVTITVAIFDRSGTPAIVPGTQEDFSGTLGTLFGPIVANQDGSGRPGQFRMLNLALPVTLPVGQYALVAWGFSFSNEILNSANTSPPAADAVSVDTFGGVLNFVEARYDDNPGVLPAKFDSFLPQYASATFSTTAISAVPEPAGSALVTVAVALLGGLVARSAARKRELS